MGRLPFYKFKEQFASEALKLVGSGWLFLVLDPKQNGKLILFVGKDHESVLYQGLPGLLICDLWEHSYYLKHQNQKADYLNAFWQTVDWTRVAARYDGIRSGAKQL